MKLKEIIRGIEQCIPIRQAEDFDNVGLLCGIPERDITGILICHDALETVVDEAIDRNANLIVSFHPIIFSGLKSLTGKNYVERAVMKAIENKIAIYAVHTAWDNDFFGVNFGICKTLGLENQKILMPKPSNLMQLSFYVPPAHSQKVKNALFDAGAGHLGFYDHCAFTMKGLGSFRPMEGADPFSGEIGKVETDAEEMVSVVLENYKKSGVLAALQEAHPYEEVAYNLIQLENENQYAGLGRYGELPKEMTEDDFLNFIKEKFGLEMIRHSAFTSKKIKKVAVLGGSGASAISKALVSGCDAYLTGDLKYHDFYRAENQMLLCDIGHFESEQFVTQQLFDLLSEKFPKFAILKSQVNTNPVKYFF